MSYDISLEINTGKTNTTVVDIGNYTSNIGGMFNKAFKTDNWKFINGAKAIDALPAITEAVEEMKNNPEEYKALNPSNGWGSYEGALKFLSDLMEGCKEHPETIIYISY